MITPKDLMPVIRLATTGEMREWLEAFQKKDPSGFDVLAQIMTGNPPARLYTEGK